MIEVVIAMVRGVSIQYLMPYCSNSSCKASKAYCINAEFAGG